MTVRKSVLPIIAGVLALGTFGCATTGGGGGTQAGGEGGGEAAMSADPDDYRCPADIPGTKVDMVETQHGVSLVYTTDDPEMVEVLRQKVHTLPGEIARRQSALGADREIPRIQSSSDDVDQGAQVVFLPMLPEDRVKLQNYAHQRAPGLTDERCPEESLVR